MHCKAPQHAATHCIILHHTLHHTASHRTILQHTAAHCNPLQHTATHCTYRGTCSITLRVPMMKMPLQHTAAHYNTLQHAVTCSNTLQHTAIHRNTPQHLEYHAATHCNTLQHTATHCDTLHHTATPGASHWEHPFQKSHAANPQPDPTTSLLATIPSPTHSWGSPNMSNKTCTYISKKTYKIDQHQQLTASLQATIPCNNSFTKIYAKYVKRGVHVRDLPNRPTTAPDNVPHNNNSITNT